MEKQICELDEDEEYCEYEKSQKWDWPDEMGNTCFRCQRYWGTISCPRVELEVRVDLFQAGMFHPSAYGEREPDEDEDDWLERVHKLEAEQYEELMIQALDELTGEEWTRVNWETETREADDRETDLWQAAHDMISWSDEKQKWVKICNDDEEVDDND